MSGVPYLSSHKIWHNLTQMICGKSGALKPLERSRSATTVPMRTLCGGSRLFTRGDSVASFFFILARKLHRSSFCRSGKSLLIRSLFLSFLPSLHIQIRAATSCYSRKRTKSGLWEQPLGIVMIAKTASRFRAQNSTAQHTTGHSNPDGSSSGCCAVVGSCEFEYQILLYPAISW